MYIFQGTEGPKKFIIWNIDIQSKIVMDTSNLEKWYTIFTNILKLTNTLAKAIAQDIIN